MLALLVTLYLSSTVVTRKFIIIKLNSILTILPYVNKFYFSFLAIKKSVFFLSKTEYSFEPTGERIIGLSAVEKQIS